MVGASATIMYYCIGYIPVSMVTTLFNIGPIFIFFIEAIAHEVDHCSLRNL
jgi:drug/metabolite transporter (DMT)-like permease